LVRILFKLGIIYSKLIHELFRFESQIMQLMDSTINFNNAGTKLISELKIVNIMVTYNRKIFQQHNKLIM
jgi:hypothetical protein